MMESPSHGTLGTMSRIYLLYETKTLFRAANKSTVISNIVELHMIVTRKQDTLMNGAHGG